MKIEKIVDELCSHQINKEQALDRLYNIIESYKTKNHLDASITNVSFDINDNLYLKIELRYQYSKINLFEIGQKIGIIP